MEPAGQSRRLLSSDRALWLGRSGRYTYLRAGAGTGSSFPDQPLWLDVRRDHRVEPGQGRPRRQPAQQERYSINPAGFTIHSAIHEVREDAGCVLHLHTPDGTAVASCMEGLLPLNQTAQFVTHDLAYQDYEGVALDHDERPRLQKDLGNKNHMLLRNHGTLTVGRSVASAFERMYHLERACTMQVRTRMLGPTAYPVEETVIDKNEQMFSNADRAELRSTQLVWPP